MHGELPFLVQTSRNKKKTEISSSKYLQNKI